jgi:hypothetical protein
MGKDGSRRFRTAYIEIGKGGGKTPLAAGIGLYGLVADQERGAEIYAAAVTRDQAGILFRDATLMVDASPALTKRIDKTAHNLAFIPTQSFFRPVSSEGRSLDGKRVHMALIDEIHEHRTPIVVDKMRAGTKGRRQALIFEITNALSINTPIPTPIGFKKMGEIAIGDQIFDERGKICNVLATTEQMSGHRCYSVKFDDGSEIVADGGHLWKTKQKRTCRPHSDYLRDVKKDGDLKKRRRLLGEENPIISCLCECGNKISKFDKNGRSRDYIPGHNQGKRNPVGIRTTEEIRQTLHYQNFSNHIIEISLPISLPEIELPVDPYTLGIWLGDGDSREANICVAEADANILEEIRKSGLKVSNRKSISRAPSLGYYRIGGTGKRGRLGKDSLNAKLRLYGLLNNKHIPPKYLRASFDQRLSLLQGLMDTDGSISPRSGRCVFVQHREALSRQVAELICSLGMKCIVRKGFSKLKGKNFNRWDIFFYPPWNLKVFRLPRKAKENKIRHNRARM